MVNLRSCFSYSIYWTHGKNFPTESCWTLFLSYTGLVSSFCRTLRSCNTAVAKAHNNVCQNAHLRVTECYFFSIWSTVWMIIASFWIVCMCSTGAVLHGCTYNSCILVHKIKHNWFEFELIMKSSAYKRMQIGKNNSSWIFSLHIFCLWDLAWRRFGVVLWD